MGHTTAEGNVSFWEKIDPPTFVAGLIGTGFVLVAFALAAVVIRKTETSDDVEIVRQRFAQVMFVGILTLFIFTSILYFFSPEKSAGQAIFDKAVTAMTPLAGVIIGYLFGSKTDRTQTEQKPSEGSTQTVRPR
jgi:hypothetical protein